MVWKTTVTGKKPKRTCVILRGLPNSGKSFLAAKIKDAQKVAGKGDTTKVFSIDDYFNSEDGSAGDIALSKVMFRNRCTFHIEIV